MDRIRIEKGYIGRLFLPQFRESKMLRTSDLFGPEPIWHVWLERIFIGGSGDLIGGVE